MIHKMKYKHTCNGIHNLRCIDTNITQFICMVRISLYLHEYNMTFNDFYCLITFTMKVLYHHNMVTSHILRNVLHNLSGQSPS